MRVTMRTTAAGPERILHEGCSYDLPRAIAESLMTNSDGSGKPYAVLAAPGAKITRLPDKPDPTEHDDPAEETDESEEE